MRKHRFAIGLTIYTVLMLTFIAGGLSLFWQYIAAYERSQPDGAMADYMADGLRQDIDGEIDRFAAAHETSFESSGDIAAALRWEVETGRLTYGKSLRDSTAQEPVYNIRLDGREMGRVWLRPGDGPRDFGFHGWVVDRAEMDFGGLAQDYTVLAPVQAPLTLNGRSMTASGCPATLEEPPELLPYADQLAQMPQYARYAFSAFLPVGLGLAAGGEDYLLSREGNVFTVTQPCPPELPDQLYRYAEDFVRAYIDFTSGAVEEPDIVIGYVTPGGALSQRIYAAVEGLSWIIAVTGSLSDLTVDSLQYYGSAATLEAHYVITTYGRIVTDNNMKIILTQTELGWRVAEIELFEV